jgi:hypothetical protein
MMPMDDDDDDDDDDENWERKTETYDLCITHALLACSMN